MFIATKFVVAGASLALFGGFLLAGVLTQPNEEPLPAAVSSPPSLTTAELLEDFVIEEVEPGIVKVVDDGTGRGLLQLDDIADIAIGPEGAVWLHARTGTLFRLGGAGEHNNPGSQVGCSDYLAFSPDGTLHTFEGSTVVKVDPETPEPGQATGSGSDGLHAIGPDRSDPRFHGTSIAIGPDGDIWASWIRDSEMNPGASSVMRFDGEAWTEHGTPDGLAGVRALGNGAFVCDIAARERDIVWCGVCGAGGAGFGDGALVRFDGTTWTEVDPFAAIDRPDLRVSDVQSLALGPGGTLWAMTITNTASSIHGEGNPSAQWLDDPLRGPVLVHFDGERWTAYPIDEVVADADPLYLFAASMVVDAMGTLWLGADHSNLQTGASALVSFDGTTATRYPSIAGARALAVGPGGGVWVANRDGLYVITPEAVADE